MPLETDIYNMQKRVRDRIEELQEVATKKEQELLQLKVRIDEGREYLNQLDQLHINMDIYFDQSGGLLDEGD